MPRQPDRARSKFAGGDQSYLREVQYADGANLNARWLLHQKYRSHPVPWMAWARDLVDVRPRSSVLEAGCGPGYLWATDSGPVLPGVSLTLTDLSPGMVADAVARATRAGWSAIGREADLQDLPFDDATFDRAVALHMLYHLPDPRSGVAELARVLRPEGRLVVATSGGRHMRELWDVYHEVLGYSPLDDVVDVFGIDNGFTILRDSFERVTWHAYDDTLVCTDPDDVLRYLVSGVPGDVTPDRLAALRDAVRARFERGGGRFVVEKETGCFACERPRR